MTRATLHPGAVEHYVHAAAYDGRYAGRTEDIAYYLRRLGTEQRVLEFGAGAGRLTIPLAARGHRVTAVDTSAPMLELLQKKLTAAEPRVRRRIRAVVGDMREHRDRRRYDWVVAAFHTVCHLYSNDDLRAFLTVAHRQLVPGGRLVFDVPFPRIDMPGYDALSGVRVTEMDGPEGPELLTQRWYQPAELEMHLAYAGFRAVRITSDFSGQPIDRETSVMVVAARKPLPC